MEALKEKPGRQREQVKMDNWNDDRLDELSDRVDDGFKEMREGFARVDREMKEGFGRVDREMKAGFAEVRGEMRYVGERVDRLAHAMMVGGISFGLTALATIAGLVLAQV